VLGKKRGKQNCRGIHIKHSSHQAARFLRVRSPPSRGYAMVSSLPADEEGIQKRTALGGPACSFAERATRGTRGGGEFRPGLRACEFGCSGDKKPGECDYSFRKAKKGSKRGGQMRSRNCKHGHDVEVTPEPAKKRGTEALESRHQPRPQATKKGQPRASTGGGNKHGGRRKGKRGTKTAQ